MNAKRLKAPYSATKIEGFFESLEHTLNPKYPTLHPSTPKP